MEEPVVNLFFATPLGTFVFMVLGFGIGYQSSRKDAEIYEWMKPLEVDEIQNRNALHRHVRYIAGATCALAFGFFMATWMVFYHLSS